MNMFWMDMSPEYIFYDQDIANGKMRFKFLLLDLVFKNLFFETKLKKISTNTFPYIHVELFENLIRGNTKIDVHFYKENTYALGLIVLSLAVKFDFAALYNNLLPASNEGWLTRIGKSLYAVKHRQFYS